MKYAVYVLFLFHGCVVYACFQDLKTQTSQHLSQLQQEQEQIHSNLVAHVEHQKALYNIELITTDNSYKQALIDAVTTLEKSLSKQEILRLLKKQTRLTKEDKESKIGTLLSVQRKIVDVLTDRKEDQRLMLQVDQMDQVLQRKYFIYMPSSKIIAQQHRDLQNIINSRIEELIYGKPLEPIEADAKLVQPTAPVVVVVNAHSVTPESNSVISQSIGYKN